ncbi:MAG: hypothetical protein OEV42_16315 [Deltaproteobacteria bacterium]|nr:hypothetical protein [Deltaproteobacteria bacterium]
MKKTRFVKKHTFCLLLFFITYSLYWHLVIYVTLKELQSGTLETSGIYIISGDKGDHIVYGNKTFKDVRAGDIIFRPVAWTEKDGLYTRYSLKFFSKGIPGNAEHSSLYLGKGKIINISPLREGHSIFTGPVENTMGYYPAEKIEIIRLTDNPDIIRRAMSFINFHKALEAEQKTGFIKNIRNIRKVPFKKPFDFGKSSFDYYLSGFNCNYLIIYAYEYGGYKEFQKIQAPWSELVYYGLFLLIFPGEKNIKAFSENIVFSGDDIKKHALKIITAQ